MLPHIGRTHSVVVPIIVPIEVVLPAVIIICGISVYYCRIYFSPVNCRIPFFGVIIVSVIDAFLMIPSLEFLAFQQVYRRERKSDTSICSVHRLMFKLFDTT